MDIDPKEPSDWHPLTDIYSEYNAGIQDSIHGEDDYNNLYSAMWPEHLDLGELEQADINRFVFKRTREMMAYLTLNKLDNRIAASFIFKALMVGLLWEKERIGS